MFSCKNNTYEENDLDIQRNCFLLIWSTFLYMYVDFSIYQRKIGNTNYNLFLFFVVFPSILGHRT